jgi:aspartyl-tRNA synthetase
MSTVAAANLISRYRSHTCGGLRSSDIGAEIQLSGWVHRIRDHGGLLFIDLRDHYGLTQVVIDPASPAFKDAEKIRSEWCVALKGTAPRGHGERKSAHGRDRGFRNRH